MEMTKDFFPSMVFDEVTKEFAKWVVSKKSSKSVTAHYVWNNGDSWKYVHKK